MSESEEPGRDSFWVEKDFWGPGQKHRVCYSESTVILLFALAGLHFIQRFEGLTTDGRRGPPPKVDRLWGI